MVISRNHLFKGLLVFAVSFECKSASITAQCHCYWSPSSCQKCLLTIIAKKKQFLLHYSDVLIRAVFSWVSKVILQLLRFWFWFYYGLRLAELVSNWQVIGFCFTTLNLLKTTKYIPAITFHWFLTSNVCIKFGFIVSFIRTVSAPPTP